MSEEYVKISRETYDELELCKRTYIELQSELENINEDFLIKGKALGLKKVYTDIGYGFTNIDYYSNDEIFVKINNELKELQKLCSEQTLDYISIPSWIRRLFKAD